MKPIDILKLVGFATGAALHFYIAWLIWKRRLGPGQQIAQTERLINVLNLCLAVWFLGNLFTTLHELLLTRERLTFLLRAWDTLAMTGVALMPAALLHAHIAAWASLDGYKRWTERTVARLAWLLYSPMIFLPYAIYRINSGSYRPFLLKLHVLLIPYSVWYVMNLWTAAYLDLKIRDRLDASAARERTFFNRLAVLLAVNAVFEFFVVAILGSGPADAPWVAFILSSLFPIFFVAYHVYRYKFVDVAVRESLVYAVFALLFIAVYTYGVRRFDQFLVDKFEITPGVVEVILILGMVALASPLVRVIDRAVLRLFTREIGLYRDVVRQVSSGAGGFGELASLIRYAEDTICRGLAVSSVRIISLGTSGNGSIEQRLADRLIEKGADLVEGDEDLSLAGATIAYALRREGELIGLMLIKSAPHSLTSEKRAILDVLAGQVAIEVETCRLVEEKIRLERELAHRERLATLGQMAAQVAHEVKNPLSSIKSIVQVMREESAAAPYDRDLRLIVTEIDRLNRTVSQLLAFSRPTRADAQAVKLDDLIHSTVTFASAEAGERGVGIHAESNGDVLLDGALAGALREALSNLILNGVQACQRGGRVAVRTLMYDTRLRVEVIDDGPGIAKEDQQKVFEPFYSTKSRGTGLGLAIVQRRVIDMGGILELISPVTNDRGTLFRIDVTLRNEVSPATGQVHL
jgi:signal transduction histidine kinase